MTNPSDPSGATGLLILTESAAAKARELLQSPEAAGKQIRVGVKPGGCAGWEYDITFDVRRDGDTEIASDGVTVLLDARAAGFLRGTRLDYAQGPTGGGFQFLNPNVKSSCGCGKSNVF